MAGKVLCPSLPDLLRKTVLTFCEGSVKFSRSLEVIGSLHIRSDNERVATFLLDEQLLRSELDAAEVRLEHASQLESTFALQKDYLLHEQEGSFGATDAEIGKSQPIKKSRKTLKPMRKINYGYSQSNESSDGDSDIGCAIITEGEAAGRGPEPVDTHQSSQSSEKTGRQYRDNLDSNESISSDANTQPTQVQQIIKTHQSRITSPLGPVVLEASSTRPDDMLPPSQPSLTSESSVVSNEEGLKDYYKESSTDHPRQGESSSVVVKTEGIPCITYEDYSSISQPSSTISEPLYTTSQSKIYGVGHDRVGFVQSYAAAVYEAAYRASLEQSQALSTAQETVSSPAVVYTSEAGGLQYYRTPEAYQPSTRDVSMSSPVAAAIYQSAVPKEALMASAMSSPQEQGELWEKSVACQECGRVLKSERMLELHINTAHTHKTVYPCKQCGKTFYAASSLHSHKKRTHTSIEQKYKCPHCPRCYAFQSELLRHIDTSHSSFSSSRSSLWSSQSSTDTQSSSVVQSTNQSTELSSQDSQSGVCLPHESEATPTSVGSSEMGAMAEGMEDSAAGDPRAARPVKCSVGLRFKCFECGMLLKSRECLALHMNAKHTQKQAYPCNVCGRVFYAPSSRFCHMRRVHASKEQKFPCSYCDKVFTFHYELRNHMKLMHRSKLIQRAGGINSSLEVGLQDSAGDTSTELG